jgi:mRNA interferase RelE/StbE
MKTKNEKKLRKLDLKDTVLKYLKELPPKQSKQVALTILALTQNATPHDSIGLTGHAPWRRVDIGEYRVVYRFDDNTIYVPVVGKGNDSEVYRHLPR